MSLQEDAGRAIIASAGEEWLTVKEYAALFQVTPNAVYTAIRRKTLPYPLDRPLGPRGEIQIRVPAAVVQARRCA